MNLENYIRIWVLIIVCILNCGTVMSQKEDYIWLYGLERFVIVLPDRAADTTLGASNIDFNYDPPKIYYDPNRFLDFLDCNSSVCDGDGKILAYIPMGW